MPINALIFDMDDVLCTYDVSRRIARIASDTGRSESHIRQAIWESDYFARADRGEWSAEACLEEFGNRLGVPISRADWIAARREAMTPDAEMLDFVSRAKLHMPVALLTNNDRLFAATLDDIFPALRPLFEPHLYVSAELDRAKPDPQIFHSIVARLGVAPDETLFIDDLEENIEGARIAGLQGVRFIDCADFKSALARFDLPKGVGFE